MQNRICAKANILDKVQNNPLSIKKSGSQTGVTSENLSIFLCLIKTAKCLERQDPILRICYSPVRVLTQAALSGYLRSESGVILLPYSRSIARKAYDLFPVATVSSIYPGYPSIRLLHESVQLSYKYLECKRRSIHWRVCGLFARRSSLHHLFTSWNGTHPRIYWFMAPVSLAVRHRFEEIITQLLDNYVFSGARLERTLARVPCSALFGGYWKACGCSRLQARFLEPSMCVPFECDSFAAVLEFFRPQAVYLASVRERWRSWTASTRKP